MQPRIKRKEKEKKKKLFTRERPNFTDDSRESSSTGAREGGVGTSSARACILTCGERGGAASAGRGEQRVVIAEGPKGVVGEGTEIIGDSEAKVTERRILELNRNGANKGVVGQVPRKKREFERC